ncbi:MAG TPA: hypothetical protein VL132_02980, partial [Planctomycetaceae bacterium]|nr:hypothetical protein [Planctomycetaceae bacterium]
ADRSVPEPMVNSPGGWGRVFEPPEIRAWTGDGPKRPSPVSSLRLDLRETPRQVLATVPISSR